MARLKIELERQVREEQVIQFFFFTQWDALHAAASRKGIRVVGDLPVFAAPDSADVWANRELFLLDRDGRPTVVSGVPPDYFAATGQLWGNPLYDWDEMARQEFRFWIQRIRSACRMFDLVRIDHFRGFEACWSVPAGERTAERGEWVKVPGVRLFEEMEKELGSLPLIAEDLGVITPEVNALRERFGFPGMRILQFAFDRGESGRLASDNRFLPHNHAPDSVVYTGTHDNDTTRGWWAARRQEERDYLERYCGATDPEIEWRLIRMAMSSVCRCRGDPLPGCAGAGLGDADEHARHLQRKELDLAGGRRVLLPGDSRTPQVPGGNLRTAAGESADQSRSPGRASQILRATISAALRLMNSMASPSVSKCSVRET